jgi:hypothetical protein
MKNPSFPPRSSHPEVVVGRRDYGPRHDQGYDFEAVLIDLDEARARRFARSQQNLTARGLTVPADADSPSTSQWSLMPASRLPYQSEDAPDLDALVESLQVRIQGNVRSSRTSTGSAVHALIAALCPLAPALDAVELTELVLRLSYAVCTPGRQHRTNSTHVAGFVAEYLRGPCRPARPWEFIDSEHPAGRGRVDLTWRNTESGHVLFDEIKTTSTARRFCEPDWVDQAQQYAVAGSNEFGPRFLGVRLIPLGSMNVAALVLADGTCDLIQPTPSDPLRARLER